MTYLISAFDCVLFLEDKAIEICANVKYKLSNINKQTIVFPLVNAQPFLFDERCEQVLKTKVDNDIFYFLFSNAQNTFFVNEFNFNTNKVMISLSNKLNVTVNGVLICEKIVENLKFSHFEIFGELCLIYFEGKRNFLVVIKQKELCFADYYDECNVDKDEKYFMCKLKDSLNHGLVCHIKDKKFDSYLVYLDDQELNLKEEFIPFVFCDCIKAKNYVYANALLCEDLKLEDAKQVAKFFPEFDWFYPLNEKQFILTNKNTLAGIYEFDILDNKISNIITR